MMTEISENFLIGMILLQTRIRIIQIKYYFCAKWNYNGITFLYVSEQLISKNTISIEKMAVYLNTKKNTRTAKHNSRNTRILLKKTSTEHQYYACFKQFECENLISIVFLLLALRRPINHCQ